MSVHIFTVPFDPKQQGFQDEDLRAFLSNKRVTKIRPRFFQVNGQAFWSVFVEYDSLLSVENRAVEGLNEPQRVLWQRLQEWRKETAEKGGIPVYIIATNKQLADVVRHAPRTLEALRQIHGFGHKKVGKYGQELITMITAFYEQTPEKPTHA
jgi:superfamily II DNA helicase RecQ